MGGRRRRKGDCFKRPRGTKQNDDANRFVGLSRTEKEGRRGPGVRGLLAIGEKSKRHQDENDVIIHETRGQQQGSTRHTGRTTTKKEGKKTTKRNPPDAFRLCVRRPMTLLVFFAADLSLRLSPLRAQPPPPRRSSFTPRLTCTFCVVVYPFISPPSPHSSPFSTLPYKIVPVSSYHLLAARAPVPSSSTDYMFPHLLVPLHFVLTILLCRHRLSHNNTQKPPPRLAARIMHHNSAPPTTAPPPPCEGDGDGDGGCWRELLYSA